MRPYVRAISLSVLVVGCVFLFSGCLKTKIITGKPPSSQTVELPWAHGFVLGLVPPVNAPLAVGDQCENGISQVYFRQPFVQWFAQGVTSSIYTPQTFTVTCASSGSMSSLEKPPAYLLRDSQATAAVVRSETEGTAPSSRKK